MSDSLITKKAIAQGIKELTKTKNFDKITIQDITKICGLNRQTFYYHFQDKYDLINWIYYNDIIAVTNDSLTYENGVDRILLLLSNMKTNDYFYTNTLNASVRNEFEEYLNRVITELFFDIITRIAKNSTIPSEQLRFIAKFYAFGLTGTIVSWAVNGMKESPEYISKQLEQLIYGTERFAFVRFQEKSGDHPPQD